MMQMWPVRMVDLASKKTGDFVRMTENHRFVITAHMTGQSARALRLV